MSLPPVASRFRRCRFPAPFSGDHHFPYLRHLSIMEAFHRQLHCLKKRKCSAIHFCHHSLIILTSFDRFAIHFHLVCFHIDYSVSLTPLLFVLGLVDGLFAWLLLFILVFLFSAFKFPFVLYLYEIDACCFCCFTLFLVTSESSSKY